MAATTGISWTDATVNFWWGCTKIGPGCDNCYAETLSNRFDKPSLWGVGADRRQIKSAKATLSKLKGGRVFIQSMSDIGDSEVPLEWFADAWAAIKANPQVQVQLVTKRLPVLLRRLLAIGEKEWPAHVGLMITVVNQEEANRDVPKLIAAKSAWSIPWIGLSCEPMLGFIDLAQLIDGIPANASLTWLDALNWVVVGGESGANARPMHPDWAKSLRNQCAAAGVPFFFKQWGPRGEPDLLDGAQHHNWPEGF